MKRAWILALTCALLGACDEAPAPLPVDAPTTPEEQLEALRATLDAAEAREDWTRAVVALEALEALDHTPVNEERLHVTRARREAAARLDEVERWLRIGDLFQAHALLRELSRASLTDTQRARRERLSATLNERFEEARVR